MISLKVSPMTLRLPLLAATALSLLPLAACGPVNRGVESVNQPVVSRTDYTVDVQVTPTGLATGETQRLRGWLDALHAGYGDTISVDDAETGVAARGDVAGVAARYGLLVADQAPVTGAPLAPGTARIVVSRARAAVPSCNDGRRSVEPAFEHNNTTDFGCAVNGNLAAMIANPTDLVRGASTGEYDPLTGTRAITSLRSAAPTGAGGTTLKSESSGGK